MRVLLDTHMMLWALTDSPRLSARARAVLADAENECWVSSASVWELALKVMRGKYELGRPRARLGEAIQEEADLARAKGYAQDIVGHGRKMAAIIRDFTGVAARESKSQRVPVDVTATKSPLP